MPGHAVRCPACGHALFVVDAGAPPVFQPAPATPARNDLGPLVLRVTEAAALLGLSRSTLYQLIGSGRVRVVRLGRTVRIPRQELERLAGGG